MNIWHRAIVILVLMIFMPVAVQAGSASLGCNYSHGDWSVASISSGLDHASPSVDLVQSDLHLLAEGGLPHELHCHGRTPATVTQSVVRADTHKSAARGADAPIGAYAIGLNLPSALPSSRASIFPSTRDRRGDAQLAAIATVILLI